MILKRDSRFIKNEQFAICNFIFEARLLNVVQSKYIINKSETLLFYTQTFMENKNKIMLDVLKNDVLQVVGQ